MTHIGYLVAGWSIGLGVLGAYALSILIRGRKLSSQVLPKRRRWMTSDGD